MSPFHIYSIIPCQLIGYDGEFSDDTTLALAVEKDENAIDPLEYNVTSCDADPSAVRNCITNEWINGLYHSHLIVCYVQI